MRRVARSIVLAALAALAALGPTSPRAGAQRAPSRPGRLGQDGQEAPERRAQMEQQLRRNLWRIAQQRIGLTDEQMTQLGQTSGRFDERRRAIVQEERAQRQALRQELRNDASADQARVATALDRLQQLQRQRIDLQIEEQRAFAAFMTPVQRAKYAALQEQVRRRVEMLRRQRADGGRADSL